MNSGQDYGGHRLTSFFLSNRWVASCILVDLARTVKAHFAGIVVFEPCIHIARIQLQVCVETIIRQFLFPLKFQYPAMDQRFRIIVSKRGIPHRAIARQTFK